MFLRKEKGCAGALACVCLLFPPFLCRRHLCSFYLSQQQCVCFPSIMIQSWLPARELYDNITSFLRSSSLPSSSSSILSPLLFVPRRLCLLIFPPPFLPRLCGSLLCTRVRQQHPNPRIFFLHTHVLRDLHCTRVFAFSCQLSAKKSDDGMCVFSGRRVRAPSSSFPCFHFRAEQSNILS